jgi:hypothetical protein
MAAMKRFVCVLAMLSTTPSRAQNDHGARVFVNRVYARYSAIDAGAADLLLGKDASQIFSPSLFNLMKLDHKRAGSGYVGRLDNDPVCDCQDPDGLRVVELSIRPQVPSRATATVRLRFSGTQARVVRLELVQLQQGWRIDNISTAGVPSLRKLLQ